MLHLSSAPCATQELRDKCLINYASANWTRWTDDSQPEDPWEMVKRYFDLSRDMYDYDDYSLITQEDETTW